MTNWTKGDSIPHLSHASPTISDLKKMMIKVSFVSEGSGVTEGVVVMLVVVVVGVGDLKQTHLKCGKYPRRLESSKMRES